MAKPSWVIICNGNNQNNFSQALSQRSFVKTAQSLGDTWGSLGDSTSKKAFDWIQNRALTNSTLFLPHCGLGYGFSLKILEGHVEMWDGTFIPLELITGFSRRHILLCPARKPAHTPMIRLFKGHSLFSNKFPSRSPQDQSARSPESLPLRWSSPSFSMDLALCKTFMGYVLALYSHQSFWKGTHLSKLPCLLGMNITHLLLWGRQHSDFDHAWRINPGLQASLVWSCSFLYSRWAPPRESWLCLHYSLVKQSLHLHPHCLWDGEMGVKFPLYCAQVPSQMEVYRASASLEHKSRVTSYVES